jgi:hypothetical protein
VLTGEWVHSYDHRAWWHDAEEVTTLALFSPGALAEYPEDKSFAFIRSDEWVHREAAVRPPGTLTYQDAMREKGVVLQQPPLSGIQYVMTGHEAYHLEEDGYGDWSWDLIKLNDSGLRVVGEGTENEDYVVWGEPITLPTSGTVVEVIRDEPDNVPGTYEDQATNNLLGVHLFGNYYLYLLHLQQGSLPPEIQVGDTLAAGTPIGRVGNSGVTLEPHLHLTVYYYDDTQDPPRSWGVPAEFADLHTKTTWLAPSSYAEFSDPGSGTWISAEAF